MLGRLKELGSAPIKNPISLAQLLRRTEIFFGHLHLFDEGLPATEDQVAFEVETRLKYEGYIGRQEGQVEKLKRMEDTSLPEGIDDKEIHGLTSEVREKLGRIRPFSLGQASRVAGVTPAAIMAIQVHMAKHKAYFASDRTS